MLAAKRRSEKWKEGKSVGAVRKRRRNRVKCKKSNTSKTTSLSVVTIDSTNFNPKCVRVVETERLIFVQ